MKNRIKEKDTFVYLDKLFPKKQKEEKDRAKACLTITLDDSGIEGLLYDYGTKAGIDIEGTSSLMGSEATMYLYPEDEAKLTVQYDFVTVSIKRIKRTFNFPLSVIKSMVSSENGEVDLKPQTDKD